MNRLLAVGLMALVAFSVIGVVSAQDPAPPVVPVPPVVPKALTWSADSGIATAPTDVKQSTAKFPVWNPTGGLRLVEDKGPIFKFTQVTAGMKFVRMSVSSGDIIGFVNCDPSEFLWAAHSPTDPTKIVDLYAGHTVCVLKYRGNELPEEAVILGDANTLTNEWGYLTGRPVINLTYEEK